jgi:hypothetical protein
MDLGEKTRQYLHPNTERPYHGSYDDYYGSRPTYNP